MSGMTFMPRAVVLIVTGALAGRKAVDRVQVCMAGCARGMLRVVGHRGYLVRGVGDGLKSAAAEAMFVPAEGVPPGGIYQ
jgi:hypothetical protein